MFEAVNKMEDSVNLYRMLAALPNLENAESSISGGGNYVVNSLWSQKDLTRNCKTQISKSWVMINDSFEELPSTEVRNEIFNVTSPSGAKRAILCKVTEKNVDKQYLEIWNSHVKVKSFSLSDDNFKEINSICENSQFGGISWSPNEEKIAFIVEKKLNSSSYFEQQSKDSADESKGNKFEYRDCWGEQNVGNVSPAAVVLDVNSDVTQLLDFLPTQNSYGQVQFVNSHQVVLVGWCNEPYRLGIIYCPIRSSELFMVNTVACTFEVVSGSGSVRSPRVSPSGQLIAFLDNPTGGPHFRASRLSLYDVESKKLSVVIEIVKRPPAGEFPGIFQLDLPARCWAADSGSVYFSSLWRSQQVALVCLVGSGMVHRIDFDPWMRSVVILDVCPGPLFDLLTVSASSLSSSPSLVVAAVRAAQPDPLFTHVLSRGKSFVEIETKVYSLAPKLANEKHPGLDYDCLLLSPAPSGPPLPLCVYNHGGPHSAFSNSFVPYVAGLCLSGFAVLMVNYRGSIGFGQDFVDSLPGLVGSQDVSDVEAAVDDLIGRSDLCDPSKVVMIGGSHGGFLTGHLIARNPKLYRAAVMRNPVIDMTTMWAATDITDWCAVEGGFEFSFGKVLDEDCRQKLWESSPLRLADQIACPVMLMVGLDDRRVPPFQSHQLRKHLLGRGVPVRLLSYPENSHPLSGVEAESDAFVNIIAWFRKWLDGAGRAES